jgi:hypothetical protein
VTDERMDEILGTEEDLVPSSGFVSSVMDRVREEAAAPQPIPFPWKHALPGFVLAAGVFGWTAVEFARQIGPAIATLKLPPVHVTLAASQPLEQAGWVAAALVISLASWIVSRRFCR